MDTGYEQGGTCGISPLRAHPTARFLISSEPRAAVAAAAPAAGDVANKRTKGVELEERLFSLGSVTSPATKSLLKLEEAKRRAGAGGGGGGGGGASAGAGGGGAGPKTPREKRIHNKRPSSSKSSKKDSAKKKKKR